MMEIDGSEGGGQLLRSSLAFAALTEEPLEMTGIRGARSNPGLRPQHLTAVELLSDVCDAEVSAVEVGTETLTFEPGDVVPGRYTVDIGTAGSVTLLFDAVLPLAATIDGPLEIVARGGTDVKWSPTMAYYRAMKLPLLRRYGLEAVVEVDRPGFYPVGGGEATLRLAPSSLSRLELTERGAFAGARVHSLAATDLADGSVAERQASQAVERLENDGLGTIERTVRYAEADSPGSALSIRLDYEGTLAGFDALGEQGKPAESVADDAVEEAIEFHENSAAVDRHAADQLLVFLAIAGGRVVVPEVTDHLETNRRLLSEFGFDVSIEPRDEGVLVEN